MKLLQVKIAFCAECPFRSECSSAARQQAAIEAARKSSVENEEYEPVAPYPPDDCPLPECDYDDCILYL